MTKKIFWAVDIRDESGEMYTIDIIQKPEDYTLEQFIEEAEDSEGAREAVERGDLTLSPIDDCDDLEEALKSTI